jgi:hypothetical protein
MVGGASAPSGSTPMDWGPRRIVAAWTQRGVYGRIRSAAVLGGASHCSHLVTWSLADPFHWPAVNFGGRRDFKVALDSLDLDQDRVRHLNNPVCDGLRDEGLTKDG